MTAGFSHSPAAKLKAAVVLTAAVLLLAGCLEIFGPLPYYRLKTLDLLFRHVPLARPPPSGGGHGGPARPGFL